MKSERMEKCTEFSSRGELGMFIGAPHIRKLQQKLGSQ
jgi:hypothetical protein